MCTAKLFKQECYLCIMLVELHLAYAQPKPWREVHSSCGINKHKGIKSPVINYAVGNVQAFSFTRCSENDHYKLFLRLKTVFLSLTDNLQEGCTFVWEEKGTRSHFLGTTSWFFFKILVYFNRRKKKEGEGQMTMDIYHRD